MIDQNRVMELVKLFQNGDKTAFDRLYSLFYNRQYYFVYKMLRDEYTAQDVVQEIFLKVYESLDTVEEPKAFLVWLNKVTYHCCLNHIEKSKQEKRGIYPLEDFAEILECKADTDPYTLVQKKERDAELMKAIDTLPLSLKSTVILKYFNGLKEKEIAEVLNCPVGTVKSRLSAAKKYLAQNLKGVVGIFTFVAVAKSLRLEAYASCGVTNGAPVAAYGTFGITCAAAAVSLAVAVGGPEFRAVKTTVQGDIVPYQIIEAEVTSALPVKTIIMNDEEAVLQDGICQFLVEKNGIYNLILTDSAGRTAEHSVTIDNIDDQSPEISGYEIDGDYAVLYITDDRSGIDWTNSKVKDHLGNEEKLEQWTGTEAIRINVYNAPLELTIEDLVGNGSRYQINVDRRVEAVN